MYFIVLIIILIAILFAIVFHWRQKTIICKLCNMPKKIKCRLLNKLVEPLGYWYDPRQDIFSSTPDAWQKIYGYAEIYNHAAPFFNMIFDCQPVYFNYDGKTWLIEFWKGQYGINTGSEVGIYRADSIVPPAARDMTLFHAVKEEEYLEFFTRLRKNCCPIASLREEHWWLTIFSMGCFSRPKELSLDISIRFPDLDMRDAFLDAMLKTGYDLEDFYICCTTVSFTFRSSHRHVCFPKRLFCCLVQLKNRLFCRLYRFVTRSFQNSCDKLLYLYFYLPFVFRRMLRLRRFSTRKNKSK